jgi:glycine C-acetyltransferase
MSGLQSCLEESVGSCRRIIIVSDGVFSMRGDHAPLHAIADLAEKYSPQFDEEILTVIDDAHGAGVLGETGRGTAELTGEDRIDIIIGTLGKAMGVNGGYLISDTTIVSYLKETAPFYIYSHPLTPSEAGAALKALEIIDSDAGKKMLRLLKELATYFRQGLIDLGFEVIEGEHPIVPLMVRDTQKTTELVGCLKANGILATGLSFPVVPRGYEEIRFQVCADHTKYDLDYTLEVLQKCRDRT